MNLISSLSGLAHPELLKVNLKETFSELSSSEYLTSEDPIFCEISLLEDTLLLTTKSSKVSNSTINTNLPDFFPLYTNSLSKAFLYPSTEDKSPGLPNINPLEYTPSILHSSSI